jgi:hypothetical protein
MSCNGGGKYLKIGLFFRVDVNMYTYLWQRKFWSSSNRAIRRWCMTCVWTDRDFSTAAQAREADEDGQHAGLFRHNLQYMFWLTLSGKMEEQVGRWVEKAAEARIQTGGLLTAERIITSRVMNLIICKYMAIDLGSSHLEKRSHEHRPHTPVRLVTVLDNKLLSCHNHRHATTSCPHILTIYIRTSSLKFHHITLEY